MAPTTTKKKKTLRSQTVTLKKPAAPVAEPVPEPRVVSCAWCGESLKLGQWVEFQSCIVPGTLCHLTCKDNINSLNAEHDRFVQEKRQRARA